MKSPPVFRYEKLDTDGGDSMIEDKEQAEYDDDFLDFTSIADHDIFGVGPNGSSKMSKTPKTKKKKGVEQQNKTQDNIGKQSNSTEGNSIEEGKEKKQKEPRNKGKRLHKDVSSCSDDTKTPPKKNKAIKTEQGTGSPAKLKTVSSSEKVINCSNNESQNVAHCKSEKSTSDLQPDLPSHSISSKPQDTRPSDSDCGGVLESLLDMQDSFFKPTQVRGSPTKSEKKETSQSVSFQRPWSDTLHTDWQEHMQVCYTMFSATVHDAPDSIS